jgi:hypothetical protein
MSDLLVARLRRLDACAVSDALDNIVVEQRSGIDAGCWGGLPTLGAKVRGVAGVDPALDRKIRIGQRLRAAAAGGLRQVQY